VERLRQALFGSHAYGRPAPDDALMAAVASERVAAWRRRAIVPAGAALVLVGDGDAADLRETLEHAFASWQGAPDAIDVPAMPVMTARQPRIAIVDRPGSSQACLVIGQAVHLTPNDRDFLAFTVLNQLLGGSSTSRLFVNIRSEHGYTYGAYSRAMAMSRGLLWSAHAQVRHDVAAPALAAMRAEIARVREESIPEETLTALAHYLAGRFLLTCAALDGCADVLAAYEIHRQHAEDEQRTYLARLEALTTADIGRVAREHLDPDAMVVVAVGDAASLASQWPDA
jgi:predicted Zn-dependent peptidase